ncbi:hypothetical protein, partial [Mycobacterium scrofulaceum]|uniref:hypothetical protein n=1 Tax=Mycobacterium scrofulaceum TaxID=1783 RepID=UPI001E2D235C
GRRRGGGGGHGQPTGDPGLVEGHTWSDASELVLTVRADERLVTRRPCGGNPFVASALGGVAATGVRLLRDAAKPDVGGRAS